MAQEMRRDKSGHSGTCPAPSTGTDRDSSLKGCPDVPTVPCPPDLAAVRSALKSTFGGGMTWFVMSLPDGRVGGGTHLGMGVFGGR